MALGDDSDSEGSSPIGRVQFARSLSIPSERAIAPAGAEFAEEGSAGQFDIMRYWQFVWKHRWIIAISLALALSVAAAMTLMTTPVYTAKMTIEIDREAAKVMTTQDVTPREEFGNGIEFYQTQYGLLKSRALAERVVDTENLTSNPAFLHSAGLDRRGGGRTGPTQTGRRARGCGPAGAGWAERSIPRAVRVWCRSCSTALRRRSPPSSRTRPPKTSSA